jgi:hypothetical protein
MRLQRIAFSVSDIKPRPRFDTWGIHNLYLDFLGKVEVGQAGYVALCFVPTPAQAGQLKVSGQIADYFVFFDFGEYEQLVSVLKKKKYFLKFIHESMIDVARLQGLDTEPFELAYQKCLAVPDLRVQWYYKRKLFISPDRQHYFGMFHIIDDDFYKVFEVVFDKKKNELGRRLCFRDHVGVFSVGWASWEGNNEVFYYKFKGPDKLFECRVADLLAGKQYDEAVLNLPPSRFFKK